MIGTMGIIYLFFFFKDPETQFSANCGVVEVRPYVYLQGAFLNPNSDEPSYMRDDLRQLPNFPVTSPYGDAAVLPNVNILQEGGLSGNPFDSVVDWIWVELRDDLDPSIVIDGQSALLVRDGYILNLDGTEGLSFNQPAKHYNVVVSHRNHSNIVTGVRQAFPLNSVQNFEIGAIGVTGSNALVDMNGTFAMWAGDANNDGSIRFSGANSDVNILKDFILGNPTNPFNFLTATITGYANEDINMDGFVKFSGAANDSNFIKDLVLGHPGNIINLPTFTITTEVPEN